MLTRKSKLVALLLSGFAVRSAGAATDDKQTWIALSRTAMSITGDVTLSPDAIAFAHLKLPLTPVREIDQQDLADIGNIVDSLQPIASARLYRVSISRRSRLANGNTICGANADASWMLAVYSKAQLSLAFFSGGEEPHLDSQVVASGHGLCGTFTYSLPKN